MSDNIKIGFKAIGCEDVNGISFQRPHFMYALMNVRVNNCQLFNRLKLEILLINIKKISVCLLEIHRVSITKASRLILLKESYDWSLWTKRKGFLMSKQVGTYNIVLKS